ncbi:hypothetical protein [Mycobacteroides abscessus]|uniref:hypothetical protein n=1 Tax=Mycobacteroides abscessus TaxID=36809 RepID=UPI000C26107C|nr:hypothetical protein [Mycobacteroides abscessus]
MSVLEIRKYDGFTFTKIYQEEDHFSVGSELIAPTAAYFSGKTYIQLLSTAGGSAWYHVIDQQGTVSPLKRIPRYPSATPRLVAHRGRLYMFFVDTESTPSGQFSFSLLDPATGKFTDFVNVPQYVPLAREQVLAGVSFQGALHIFGVYKSDNTYWAHGYVGHRAMDEGIDWEPLAVLPRLPSSPAYPLAAITYKNKLLLFAVGTDKISRMSQYDGYTWTQPATVGDLLPCSSGIGAAIYNNVLHVVYTLPDPSDTKQVRLMPVTVEMSTQRIDTRGARLCRYNNNAWGPSAMCTADGSYQFKHTPALVNHLSTGELYVVTRT